MCTATAGEWRSKSSRRPDEPALQVTDNVVSQPLGPALSATAFGSVAVHGNYLLSGGMVGPVVVGATVGIVQLARSDELISFNGGGFTTISGGNAAGATTGETPTFDVGAAIAESCSVTTSAF